MLHSTPRRTVLLAFVLFLLGSAAFAATYEVHLKTGTVITTRYRPVETSFDPSMVQFLTGVGNWMVLAKFDIANVVTRAESAGYGIQIDDVTLMVGLAPNDKPSPEEEAEMALAAAEDALLFPQRINYSMPTVSEPNTGGGIPIGFINQTTPPMGGGPTFGGGGNFGRGGGADAAGRRGGGGGNFAEPFTSNN